MQNADAAGPGIGDDHPPRVVGEIDVGGESPHDPGVFDPGEAAVCVDAALVDELVRAPDAVADAPSRHDRR